MQVNGTDVNLDFRKDGNKISIHAPDLFDSNYNFSGGWELDPSTQSGSTIYISDRQNLTQVSIDINNASALQDLGGGEWLLNAYLINNNTANTFYMNSSDVTWLKINSTYSWYYLTNSITEINDTKITSWSTSTNVVLTTGNRGYVLADGASSFLNITNSNLSYLGSSATNKFGVTYANNSNSNVSNSYFIRNTRGINLVNSNNSIFNNNTFFGSVSGGVDLTSSNNNTFTNNLMQGEGGSGSGMVLVSSNYNNFSNNNMTTNSGSTGRGLDYGSSSSNTFLSNQISSSGANAALYSNAATVSNSNTFENNTIFTTSGGTVSITNIFNNSFKNGSIYKPDGGNSVYVLLIDDTNIFVNTNFTSYRRINFNNNLSYFNYSNNSGTTFVNTNLSASKTLRRNINNWTLTNISLEENITSGTVTSYYNITGLNPNVEYQIYNDTNIDFNLTTDSNGQLPLFFINLNTTVKSIKVLQVASEGATTYNVSGYVNDSLGASLESVSVVNGTNFTTTNATGYYNLTMGNGTYNFTYSKSGYVTGYKDITISGDDVFNQNMTLAPEATEAQFTHTIFGAWE